MLRRRSLILAAPAVALSSGALALERALLANPDLARAGHNGGPPLDDWRPDLVKAVLPGLGLMLGAMVSQSGGLDISKLFATTLYTGNGATGQTIASGLDYTPGGAVWFYKRTQAEGKAMVSTVRGGDKYVISTASNIETTNPGAITNFGTTGFSVGGDNNINASGQNFAAWSFVKSPGFFDVVQYTGNGTSGRQIAHSLASIPGAIIVKRLDLEDNFVVYHRARGGTKGLMLNANNTESTYSAFWNDTDPTSSVFTIGSDPAVNDNGGLYVAWIFGHDTSSASVINCFDFVGSVSGETDVNLGFQPQFVITKGVNLSSRWFMFDTKRSPGFSGTEPSTAANTVSSESLVAPNNYVQLLPSGVKFRDPGDGIGGEVTGYLSNHIGIAIRAAA